MPVAQISWIDQGLPAFDTCADGFPHPGQIIRHFRQMKYKENGKPWTQHDLAQALGKQELAIREMEKQDTGLNDIAHLRLLAGLLAIPPILFGLAEAPEEQCKDITTPIWWVQRGFPAFDAGSDGFPHPGQVIRHFRQMKCKENGKPWTQCDLAQVLNKRELAIREMELRDTGLSNVSRRRFLARLFGIPPILLGLADLPQRFNGSESNPIIHQPKVLSASRHIDLEEVRDKLTSFWSKNTYSSQEMLVTINSTLKGLYERYPLSASHERLDVIEAMCELHIHAANMLRDRGTFNRSLEHLNKTKNLNDLLEEDELQADMLYRRGGVYLEKGEVSLALDDYHAAEQVLPKISPPLQAAILLESALSEARVVTSKQQCTAILTKLDRAGQIIRVKHTETGREKQPYLNVDLERYHLDRSATLIAVGLFREAQRELALLSPTHLKGRRHVYYLILQAQACFGLKEYPQAAFLIEEALPFARMMRSRVNLDRIKTLYTEFQQTPFQHNPEVERLGYLLFHT